MYSAHFIKLFCKCMYYLCSYLQLSEIINFFENTIGICKSMRLVISANTFVYTFLTDLLTQFC